MSFKPRGDDEVNSLDGDGKPEPPKEVVFSDTSSSVSALTPTGESSGDKKLSSDFVLLLHSISKSMDSKLNSQSKCMDSKIENVVDSIGSKLDSQSASIDW